MVTYVEEFCEFRESLMENSYDNPEPSPYFGTANSEVCGRCNDHPIKGVHCKLLTVEVQNTLKRVMIWSGLYGNI